MNVSRINRGLAGALAAQVGLAAVAWWPSAPERHDLHPMVTLSADAVSAVTITGRTDETAAPDPLVLEKTNSGWQIASAGGYPADGEKVSTLLETLGSLQVRRPIATDAVHHGALDVAEEDFTRRVEIAAGERQTLYMGAAQGSQVHLRAEGEDDVYSARGTTAWSVGDTASRYFEPELVAVDAETVTRIGVENAQGAFALVRDADGWAFEGPDESTSEETLPSQTPTDQMTTPEPADDEAVETLVKALVRLRATAPASGERLSGHGLDVGTHVTWTVSGEDSTETGGYRIGALVDGKHYAAVDGRPEVAQVAEYSVKRALEVTSEELQAAADTGESGK